MEEIMVAIPEQCDPTLQAMKVACEDRHKKQEKPRNYLGASIIGHDCDRYLWYQFNHYERSSFNAETLWNFEDGHRTEDLTAERLRLIDDVKLYTHKPDGNQYGFTDFDGLFKGHYDGIISGLKQAPKTWHIWECKTSSHKKFEEFKKCKAKFGEKATLLNWNKIYYVQAQIYMHYEKLDRHYTTVAYAGGRKYDSCRTEYDGDVAERYRARAKDIISAKDPPPRVSDKPDFFQCKWCDFKGVCHGKKDAEAVSKGGRRWPF